MSSVVSVDGAIDLIQMIFGQDKRKNLFRQSVQPLSSSGPQKSTKNSVKSCSAVGQLTEGFVGKRVKSYKRKCSSFD
jgi:hypothetical protein